MNRRTFLILLAAVVLGIAGLYLARGWILPAVARWLDVGESPRRADLVMLLNGGESSRPFVAAALVKGHWAPRVALAKVKLSPLNEDGALPAYHEMNCQILRRCGVAEEQIVLLEADAESTYDEAVALREYLASHPGSQVLLITNGGHSRRARWIFNRVLGQEADGLSVVSAPDEDFDCNSWWRHEKGFTNVSGEYVKLLLYGLRYGYWGGLAIAAALLFFGWRVSRRYRHPHNGPS